MSPTKNALFTYYAPSALDPYFGNLVADGDSLTFGAGVPVAYPPQLTPKVKSVVLGMIWGITNSGVNGQFLSTMVANAAANIDPLYDPNVRNNVVIIWGGINDLASSVTPATCYTNLQTYCAARHAVGWKVLVVTLPSNKFVDNTRGQLNTLLRSNHSFADGLVDFIGSPLDTVGGWSNTTWFQSDGIHPNEAGIQTYELPTFNPAINLISK